MGRELKNIALDFKWPLGVVWSGYVQPDEGESHACQACDSTGQSPQARALTDQWYGKIPFEPKDTGSTPFLPTSAVVLDFARRNLASAPAFCGTGPLALKAEAQRLCALFNDRWCHHLSDLDVEALAKEDRLREFTHDWNGSRWVRKRPAVMPSAAQVNEWSVRGFGHDSFNAWICVRAACERRAVASSCAVCEGDGVIWDNPDARAAAEAWVESEPPAGEGWQMWETVTSGSPVTPVFASCAELIDYLVEGGDSLDRQANRGGWRREAAEDFIETGSAPTLSGLGSEEGLMLLEPRDGYLPYTL